MVHESARKGVNGLLCKPKALTFCAQSGLTAACLESPHTRDFVAQEVLNYIKKWVPDQWSAVLAGNSVHADRAFLQEEMPEVLEHLHYRYVCWQDDFQSFDTTSL